MEVLIRAHSGLRWIVLILLLTAIFNALFTRRSGVYVKKDKMINLFAMITLHIQLLIGLILYFTSPKVSFVEGWMKMKPLRFFGLEHLLLMLIAIIIVTIGRRKAENAALASNKHKTIVVWFTIGLILILAGIPWPFRNFGTGWM